MHNHWLLYLLLLIPVIYMFVFGYVPMTGLVMAFKKANLSQGLYGGEWIGLKNFRDFFNGWTFWRLISNTVWISFSYLVLAFPFPVLLAIMLNESRSMAFRRTVQMVTYAPYFISTVVMVGIIMQMLSPYNGIINKFVVALGGKPINFMGVPQYFVPIYVISGVWQGMGYSAIVFIAALTNVNPELYEAARIDGASKMGKVRYIDVPEIIPTAIIMFILNMGSVMNVGFEKIFLMRNDLNKTAADVISVYVYEQGVLKAKYGLSTAVGLFNSVINLSLVMFFNFVGKRVGDVSVW
ncbi:sugar ABC transporter permease [Clostridia bacterium]|nr:sugar ABC transporter permease [Clostridia bacterium]